MWDGVTYVEPSRRPVIHEGSSAARAVVMNAGPGNVALYVWTERSGDPAREPSFSMFMPPGNTRSVSGGMIAVGLQKDGAVNYPFAAVAWRVVP